MTIGGAAYNLAPVAGIALAGLVLALAPMAWVWLRRRDAGAGARLQALTVLTLFLCFDLVMFGAYTRLTDSGLGCPDWPGCYGHTSPLGAHGDIRTAEAALPSGPVTNSKAWVEMVHRYLATGVGVLITVLAVASTVAARRRVLAMSPVWAWTTLAWVCLQGAFGALTVTWRLYPAIVTAHLLAAMVLLVLLAVQTQLQQRRPLAVRPPLYLAAVGLAGLCAVQIALGGWVSTNYAVLACSDFPTCQGSWWPPMDFGGGFSLARELGAAGVGGYLSFAALTAIHYAHRLAAYAVLLALLAFAWRLHAGAEPALRRWAWGAAALAAWQCASGVSNVVLGWPLAAAVAHTAGAAACVVWLTLLITRARLAGARWPRAARAAATRAHAAS